MGKISSFFRCRKKSEQPGLNHARSCEEINHRGGGGKQFDDHCCEPRTDEFHPINRAVSFLFYQTFLPRVRLIVSFRGAQSKTAIFPTAVLRKSKLFHRAPRGSVVQKRVTNFELSTMRNQSCENCPRNYGGKIQNCREIRRHLVVVMVASRSRRNYRNFQLTGCVYACMNSCNDGDESWVQCSSKITRVRNPRTHCMHQETIRKQFLRTTDALDQANERILRLVFLFRFKSKCV